MSTTDPKEGGDLPALGGAASAVMIPPSPDALPRLRPRNLAGFEAVMLAIAVTTGGVLLAQMRWNSYWLWGLGQVLLAIAFLQWFVLLHEAGHKTLFRTQWLNRFAGHLASVFAIIPFYTWGRIHGRHHKFTGWQDLDATTALLVSRRIGSMERVGMNVAWATWLPLFSIVYRIQNFWNIPRLVKYLSRPGDVSRAGVNALVLVVFYLVLFALVGPFQMLKLVGAGLFGSLMIQDLILLSQHTHMPRHISEGRTVRPFKPMEQEQFTRSLKLPKLFSWLLLRFDLHELHHMYVQVPGYDLHRIDYQTRNQVDFLDWVRGAKRLSGVQFLFGTRDKTGFMR